MNINEGSFRSELLKSVMINHVFISSYHSFAHYKHISYFFNKYYLSLYVYTWGLLGCLLGFWPLGQTLRGQLLTYNVTSSQLA